MERIVLGKTMGVIADARPPTSKRFNIFAPTILPIESAACPFTRALMDVISSGRDVPSATRVRDITRSGTPIYLAITGP